MKYVFLDFVFQEKKKIKKKIPIAKKLKVTKRNCFVIVENFLFLNHLHIGGTRGLALEFSLFEVKRFASLIFADTRRNTFSCPALWQINLLFLPRLLCFAAF